MSELAEPGLAGKPDGHGPAHGGAHQGHVQGAHGTFRSYMTGFVLSVILTAVPFWLVMGDVLGDSLKTSIVIMAFAAVQIVVHMIYFLHMNTKSEGAKPSWRWPSRSRLSSSRWPARYGLYPFREFLIS
jgi:cytochrome o ubiquinol oxidase operon protein cyoD